MTQLDEAALEDVAAELEKHPEYVLRPTTVRAAPPRYVAFPNGAVSEVRIPREALIELRSEKRSPWAGALDVTPNPLALAVNIALGLNPWRREPTTPLRCFPCQDCAGSAARWVVCETCGGSRRVPTVAWVAE